MRGAQRGWSPKRRCKEILLQADAEQSPPGEPAIPWSFLGVKSQQPSTVRLAGHRRGSAAFSSQHRALIPQVLQPGPAMHKEEAVELQVPTRGARSDSRRRMRTAAPRSTGALPTEAPHLHTPRAASLQEAAEGERCSLGRGISICTWSLASLPPAGLTTGP